MTRALVLGARTWGALGNYLAAGRFADVLRTRLGWDVERRAAEEHLSWVAAAGVRIEEVSNGAATPAELTADYLRLAARLAADVPAGAEVGDAPLRAGVSALAADLAASPPDVLVATKGVVTRLLQAAAREAGLRVPVVNQVTNSGLLTLPMHLTPEADLVLVPFERDVRLLVDTHGLDPSRVRAVGPLVAEAAAPRGPEQEHRGARRIVLVLCNRGGRAYVDLVAHLALGHPDVDLTFVAPGRPDLVDAARRAGLAHWSYETSLAQVDYLGLVEHAARVPGSFLVSKAGPNTVLEAAQRGIPVLVTPSGLPMEAWVPGLVRRERLGAAVDDADLLAPTAAAWLADPAPTADAREGAGVFARTHLDRARTEERIAAAVATVLEGVRT